MEKHVGFDSIRLRVWKSTVPFRFVLEDSDGQGLELNVPRLTYLPHAFIKLRRHFQLLDNHPLVLKNESGIVVPHHLPAGLLYDLYAKLSQNSQHVFVEGQVTLTISTRNKTPSRTAQTIKDVATYVWHSIKQNELLRRGSIRRIQNLTSSQSETLQESFLNLSLSTYLSASESFLNTNGMRHLPVRLYLRPDHAIQDLIPTRMEDGHGPVTVSYMMTKLAPETSRLGEDHVAVLLHGVLVRWEYLLEELLDDAAYIDGWLYFTVKQHQAPPSLEAIIEPDE